MLWLKLLKIYSQKQISNWTFNDTGFYYDFEHEPFSREDLDKIEAEMKKIIKKGARLERFTLPREDAIKYMEDEMNLTKLN